MTTPSRVFGPLVASPLTVSSWPWPWAAIAWICSVVANRTVTGIDRSAGAAAAVEADAGVAAAAWAGLEVPTRAPATTSAVNGASRLLLSTAHLASKVENQDAPILMIATGFRLDDIWISTGRAFEGVHMRV